MLKHILFFLAALFVIASYEVAADKKKADAVKKNTDDDEDEELDVTVPKEIEQVIAAEMEKADKESNDEDEMMEDEKISKTAKKDAAWGRRRRWVALRTQYFQRLSRRRRRLSVAYRGW